MNGKPVAVLLIFWDLLEQMLTNVFGESNPRKAEECLACYLHRLGLDNVGRALDLPPEAQILKVTTAYKFDQEQVAFQVTSPDFRLVMEACSMPQVEAVYNEAGFACWQGSAALVGDYAKHCDRPNHRPGFRWVGPAQKEGSWRDRPAML